ncbi:MAG TPA: hypothetical protein VFE05_17185 [Longimicrobiaceae bacterium]|jgi:phosphatidylcholine synthase|nr:hypothetical protein [Longimicrobiaceae bacterium]
MSAPPAEPRVTAVQRALAYGVHAYTASGIVFAFLAAMEMCGPRPDPRRVFLWLLVAVAVDASDGPLARAFDVKLRADRVDGRTIDDIVDYFTFTFLPLLLVWRMGWVPAPGLLFIGPALVASLFGFANTGAKDEGGGFFLGFPSYWNVVAFYAGVFFDVLGPWVNAAVILALALLTVLPVRFIYPNLVPRPWRTPVLAGAAVWAVMLVAMVPRYPHPPAWLTLVSTIYPVFYLALSFYLDAKGRRARRTA